MQDLKVKVGSAVLVGLLAACVSVRSSTPMKVAAHLSRERVLADRASVAEVIGAPNLKPGSPTRADGMTLKSYDQGITYGYPVGSIEFAFTEKCVRIADFEQQFGRPFAVARLPNVVGSPEGLGAAWKVTHQEGNVRIVLVGMVEPDGCASDLSIELEPPNSVRSFPLKSSLPNGR